ncbi:MAG: FG-GAP repeat protein [Planctomycetaceae bacterium]
MLRKEEDVYRPWRVVEIGSFPYQSVAVADLNGDKRDDLLCSAAAASRCCTRVRPIRRSKSWLPTSRKRGFVPRRHELRRLERRWHHGHGGAGPPDTYDRTRLACRVRSSVTLSTFKVFEDKSFHSDGSSGLEPREMVIADVNGDGRNDLIMLIHDRLLLYPQAAPEAAAQLPAETRPRRLANSRCPHCEQWEHCDRGDTS